MALAVADVRKDEAAINELMNQAKEAKQQGEMLFGGWFYNKSSTKKPMHLYDEKIWSANNNIKYPDVFEESASFLQTEKRENGIKSAVVYSLKTSDDPLNHYGFLLAWSDSYDPVKHTRKVYGYCGLLKNFENINWDQVEKDLDASTSSFEYIDALTRTSVKAEIHLNVVYADFM